MVSNTAFVRWQPGNLATCFLNPYARAGKKNYIYIYII